MNPVFVILVLLAGFLTWLILSWLFPFLGAVSKRLWTDAKYNMMKDEKENANDEN